MGRYRLIHKGRGYYKTIHTKKQLYIILKELTGKPTRDILQEGTRYKRECSLPYYMDRGRDWMVIDIMKRDDAITYGEPVKLNPIKYINQHTLHE